MQEVRYQGQLAAIATSDGGVLVGRMAVHEPSHPHRRFVMRMLLYAGATVNGEFAEPYTDDRAEFYARICLMPDEEFDEHHLDGNHDLAERFGVPLEQVHLKRNDLIEQWDPPLLV